MPIDTLREKLITFDEVAANQPPRRAGKAVHRLTVHRWATAGSRGIKLETVRTPGGLLTSREAAARFFDALTRAREAGDAARDRPRRRGRPRRKGEAAHA